MRAKKPKGKGKGKGKGKPNKKCPTADEITKMVSEKYSCKTFRKKQSFSNLSFIKGNCACFLRLVGLTMTWSLKKM